MACSFLRHSTRLPISGGLPFSRFVLHLDTFISWPHAVFFLRPKPQTPNHILNTADVPPRAQRLVRPGVQYPDHDRYTLQWLSFDADDLLYLQPSNNTDAAFMGGTEGSMPSELLLCYNYGAAAVKWWGKGKERIEKSSRPNIPHPPIPMPVPMGPRRTINDRSIATGKRDAARGHALTGGSGGQTDVADINGGQRGTEMDEDEVILYFWNNTQAARQRRESAEQELSYRIKQWATAVPTF